MSKYVVITAKGLDPQRYGINYDSTAICTSFLNNLQFLCVGSGLILSLNLDVVLLLGRTQGLSDGNLSVSGIDGEFTISTDRRHRNDAKRGWTEISICGLNLK